MANPIFRLKYLHPKYLPIWFLFALLRLLVFLPYPALIALGNGLGRLLYRLPLKHRHIVRCNIRAAFPSLSPSEQERLVKENFKSTSIALMELPLFWFASNHRLKKLYKINGMDYMEQALSKGKGAILLCGHFTSLLICGRMLAIDLPFNILFMEAKNELFEAIIRHYREKFYAGVIESHNVKAMVKVLRKNEICFYAPDQDFTGQNAVFAPFMGITTATLTATARLGKISGSPIVPINTSRNRDNSGYTLNLLEPWYDFPSGNDVADATRLNQFIEDHVREVPEQYFWFHRRFKTRPQGEPDFYRKAC